MKLLKRGIILAMAVLFAAVVSQSAVAQKAGFSSFPGPSISAHPMAVIKGAGLDKKNGWELEWNVRTTAASWANDFYTGVYNGLHFSGSIISPPNTTRAHQSGSLAAVPLIRGR